MKINFDSVLVNLEGEPLVEKLEKKKEDEKQLILSAVCICALFTPEQEDGKIKAEKYALAARIYKGGEVEVTADDIVLIKKCVGKIYGPLIVGQTFNLLEKVDD